MQQLRQECREEPGGAEIEITALFADIRGSTAMAEHMSAAAYSATVDEYVRTATHAIREPGGLVDKLLGDGVLGLFVPGFVGGDHAGEAVDAARTMLRSVTLPVGVGIHTGVAWVGFVGGVDDVRDFTALGDAVNSASRLSSEAAAGELLMSAATTTAASVETVGLEPRRLELRGRSGAPRRVGRADRAGFPGSVRLTSSAGQPALSTDNLDSAA